MSWTDERIELLQKMWLQGMSASKIANELADGLTRNAVIGKVYRLGLSGRGKADPELAGDLSPRHAPLPRAARILAPAEVPAGRGQSAEAEETEAADRFAADHFMSDPAVQPILRAQEAPAAQEAAPAQPSVSASFVSGNNALAAAPVERAPAPLARAFDEVVVKMVAPVTIMELRESMCRWPLGDPTQADFRFCGARRTPGAGPYCACHSALAYQPQHDRRRPRVQKAG